MYGWGWLLRALLRKTGQNFGKEARGQSEKGFELELGEVGQ